MKNLFIMILSSIGIISCSSCGSKTPSATAPDATAIVDAATPLRPLLIKKDSWELTFPSQGWVESTTCGQNSCPLGLYLFTNKDIKNVLVVLSENYNDTFEKYILNSLQGLKGSGANVLSLKQSNLDNHKFMVFESVKDDAKVWTWVGLVNKQGYQLSCGGPSVDILQHDVCLSIANTFHIK